MPRENEKIIWMGISSLFLRYIETIAHGRRFLGILQACAWKINYLSCAVNVC